IVLPLESGDGPIDPTDFEGACATLGYDPAATAVIGIVTMRDDNNNQVFTVNLKAPVLIDSHRRLGRQHVFASEKYPLRHPLQAQDRNED
ncbi:MAG: flagellar assembly protein FliW, partial [Alphaproteobacteria bacterium]|nr:flagellar assembly protein FliW [Alphaproteobacteria bacterium]